MWRWDKYNRNTIERSLNGKKVTCQQNSFLIQTVSLVIICFLLLVAISIVAITIIQKIG